VVHALNLTIGFELSLGCDLMWAAEDASFGLVEATEQAPRQATCEGR
jgi:enoyl-CoA hydratase/carnithine racemase